jgi:hypothetical protein
LIAHLFAVAVINGFVFASIIEFLPDPRKSEQYLQKNPEPIRALGRACPARFIVYIIFIVRIYKEDPWERRSR